MVILAHSCKHDVISCHHTDMFRFSVRVIGGALFKYLIRSVNGLLSCQTDYDLSHLLVSRANSHNAPTCENDLLFSPSLVLHRWLTAPPHNNVGVKPPSRRYTHRLERWSPPRRVCHVLPGFYKEFFSPTLCTGRGRSRRFCASR